jgi:hypothetical protein
MRLRLRFQLAVGITSLFVGAVSQGQVQTTRDSPVALETGLAREISVALARPTFATELDRARTQFPLLTTATQLLIAYAGNVSRLRPAATTIWDPPPPPIVLSESFCRFARTLCRCYRGDRDACITLATDPESGRPGIKLGDNLRFVVSCANLQSQYTQVLQSIVTLLGQAPLTAVQLQQLADLQARANALYNQLVERGCLTAA